MKRLILFLLLALIAPRVFARQAAKIIELHENYYLYFPYEIFTTIKLDDSLLLQSLLASSNSDSLIRNSIPGNWTTENKSSLLETTRSTFLDGLSFHYLRTQGSYEMTAIIFESPDHFLQVGDLRIAPGVEASALLPPKDFRKEGPPFQSFSVNVGVKGQKGLIADIPFFYIRVYPQTGMIESIRVALWRP